MIKKKDKVALCQAINSANRYDTFVGKTTKEIMENATMLIHEQKSLIDELYNRIYQQDTRIKKLEEIRQTQADVIARERGQKYELILKLSDTKSSGLSQSIKRS